MGHHVDDEGISHFVYHKSPSMKPRKISALNVAAWIIAGLVFSAFLYLIIGTIVVGNSAENLARSNLHQTKADVFTECVALGGDMVQWDGQLSLWLCYDTPNDLVKAFGPKKGSENE